MSEHDTGTMAMLVARRRRAIAHLSPAGKHAAFPGLYPRPAAPAPTTAPVEKLQAENTRLRAENKELRREVESLRAKCAVPPVPACAGDARFRPAGVETVMRSFCAALAAIEFRVDGELLRVVDLRTTRRARRYSWPRIVCLFLCRQICREISLPMIARHFAIDHTTVIHACRRAPDVMARDAALADVAAHVISEFEKEGGRP